MEFYMNVLVTGGLGFIGSNLAEHLLQQGHRVKILDNVSTGKRANIKTFRKHVDFVEGDIRNLGLVKREMKGIEVVFHEAALPSVPRSISDPLCTNETNVGGTLNVLMAAREANVGRIVYASSSSVYGNSPLLPKEETMPVDPCSPYALSKYAGERYCQLFHQLYGLESVCLRYFNVFGSRQDPGSQYAAVIPRFIAAVIQGQPITIFGDGRQTRDFTYITNVVEANMLAAVSTGGIGEVFNIACGGRLSINRLAQHLMAILGKKTQINHLDSRSGEVKHSTADISKAIRDLDYRVVHEAREGLRKTAEWFLERG